MAKAPKRIDGIHTMKRRDGEPASLTKSGTRASRRPELEDLEATLAACERSWRGSCKARAELETSLVDVVAGRASDRGFPLTFQRNLIAELERRRATAARRPARGSSSETSPAECAAADLGKAPTAAHARAIAKAALAILDLDMPATRADVAGVLEALGA